MKKNKLFLKEEEPYVIYIYGTRERYLPVKSFTDAHGSFHIWKRDDTYEWGVEIYPTLFSEDKKACGVKRCNFIPPLIHSILQALPILNENQFLYQDLQEKIKRD